MKIEQLDNIRRRSKLLPFLKNKNTQAASLIIKDRKPSQEPETTHDNVAHEACASLIIHAIEQKDPVLLAEALQHLFEIMESEPHKEAPHTYAAQNIKAGQE